MLAIITTTVCAAAGAVDALPVYTCHKVSIPPVIDGLLDDPAWAHAEPITFVCSETGKQATKSTTARMCYDDRNLYVAFDCKASRITATMTRRDDPVFNEDVVEIFVTPTCDMVRHFELVVSPRNVVFDADIVMAADGRSTGPGTSFAWNCEGLRTAARVRGTRCRPTAMPAPAGRWKCRFHLPRWAARPPSPASGGVETLFRIDRAPDPVEHQSWSPTMIAPCGISRAGALRDHILRG